MGLKYEDASALRGKTITSIEEVDTTIRIETDDAKEYVMAHSQDCCESARIHDIVGDLQALVGSPLVVAREEVAKDEWPADVPNKEYNESYTWTTYFFETATAKVRIRWLVESDGYYSESVQIDEV